jgi:hypothetical protein
MSSPLRLCLRVALGALALTAVDAALASDASAQRRAPQPVPVTECPPIGIDGNPAGPGTFYVVNRANQEYQAADVRPSFVPRIVDSVAREPF